MNQTKRLVLMAEDELTNFSTMARKIQKLQQKIALSVPLAEQQEVKKNLEEELPTGGFARTVETQRQAVALPFWGIAGLGLLLGISMNQPGDLLLTGGGVIAAWTLQKWGWQLQAKRLVVATLDSIEGRIEEEKHKVAKSKEAAGKE
ncbi:MAG: hypothetical protein AAF685_06865 [Cyanobacteria bacterium P01_C01_bin.89]